MNFNPSNLFSLRSYTAALFAKATKEIFPQSQWIGYEVSEIGFTAEFILPHPLMPETISLFEEKLRGFVKSCPDFRLQEMIPSNAARLFKDKGERLLEERAFDWEEELIPVVCLDNFHTIAVLPIDPFESFAFKIMDITREEQTVKVFGFAFSDKEIVKEFLKKFKEYEKRDWKKSGPEGRFLVVGDQETPLFLMKGIQIQQFLKSQFTKTLPEGALEVLTPNSWKHSLIESHLQVWKNNSTLRNSPLTSLWEWKESSGIVHQFCNEEEVAKVISSSLQFILETIRILGFEYHGILCGFLAPKFENSKGVKERWKTGLSLLKTALDVSEIAYDTDENRSTGRGPTFSIRLYDDLGRTFEGPKISIDCLASKALSATDSAFLNNKFIVVTELFPALDSLTLKLIEKYLQNTIKELGR